MKPARLAACILEFGATILDVTAFAVLLLLRPSGARLFAPVVPDVAAME